MITENDQRDEWDYQQFRIVEWDEYQDISYLVIERWWDFGPDVKAPMRSEQGPYDLLSDYYCGYVKLPRGVTPPESVSIDGIEITYTLDSKGWIGFDTMHVGQEHLVDRDAIDMCHRLINAITDG